MPHRPPKKSKRAPKSGDATSEQKRADQLAAQKRANWSAKSSLARFRNFSTERK